MILAGYHVREMLLLEEWCWRMRDMRLITFSSGDARGGFGGVGLTPLGRLLIRWAVGH